MSKCEICGEESEFESPADLCEHHWKLWWYTGIFKDIDYIPKGLDVEEKRFFDAIQNGEFLEVEVDDSADGKRKILRTKDRTIDRSTGY
jgi:hypothetical protein